MKRTKSRGIIKEIVERHIRENFNTYLLIILVFLIGIILGVFFINNSDIGQKKEINDYIQKFITILKNDYKIDRVKLLTETVKQNVVLGLSMWFIGSTIIGIPIIFGIVIYKGFSIGYTISAIIGTIGTGKGIMLVLSAILMQNILLIPGIMALAVSSIKFYKNTIKGRSRECIKIEIIRHTVFSFFITVMLIIGAIIETYISANLIVGIVKFI